MARQSAARAAPQARDPAPSPKSHEPAPGGEVVDLDGVVERRARFLAHAAATRPTASYYFVFSPDATVAALGDPGQQRSAQAQLEPALALTGGGVAKARGAVLARVPLLAAARFESLARPLIEAFLVAFDRSQTRRP